FCELSLCCSRIPGLDLRKRSSQEGFDVLQSMRKRTPAWIQSLPKMRTSRVLAYRRVGTGQVTAASSHPGNSMDHRWSLMAGPIGRSYDSWRTHATRYSGQ